MGHRILPVEIWGMIFEFSTACPEEWELGTRERYGALFSWSFGPNYTIQQWGGALKTRHSLASVSRFFNRLTTPLLYQSFFAIQSDQISRFRLTLETQPALGKHTKRLGFFLRLDMYPHELYLPIIRNCPNVTFYDAELHPCGLKLAPSIRSLELVYSSEFTPPEFLHILESTPQLEHLGLYHLPFRIETTTSRPFEFTRLGSLRSFHLRADSTSNLRPDRGIFLTVPLFFSLTLPRLESFLLEGRKHDEGVLRGIPALWLQQIRQFNVTHRSITSCSLEPNHFHQLRKLTLDFSSTSDDTQGKLREKLPLIQLEEIELMGCMSPLRVTPDAPFRMVYLVFCLRADDTATPNLRSLSTDIIDLEARRSFITPGKAYLQIGKERLDELQSVVNRVLMRGIEPKGLDSSPLRSIIQKLNSMTWTIGERLGFFLL